MHYVTRRFHWMQKHKFGVTCSTTLFVEYVPVTPEHKKQSIDVWCLGRAGMHYVTRRSYWMQKRRFGVSCPDVVFMEVATGPPEPKK
jgi:hypothetical protein